MSSKTNMVHSCNRKMLGGQYSQCHRARLVVEQFIQVVGNLRRIARQCIKSFEGQRGIQANTLYRTGIHNVTDIICLSMLSVNEHFPLHVR